MAKVIKLMIRIRLIRASLLVVKKLRVMGKKKNGKIMMRLIIVKKENLLDIFLC